MKNMKKKGEIRMFEDKQMLKFVIALLGFASIIIKGPIVPIVVLIIAISMLVYKIKRAKESPEGFEMLMFDIIIIIIIIVVNIGIFVMRISIDHTYNRSSNSEEISASDFADAAIVAYQLDVSTGNGKYAKTINGFANYLRTELEISDVNVKGNNVTCNVGVDQIIFI